MSPVVPVLAIDAPLESDECVLACVTFGETTRLEPANRLRLALPAFGPLKVETWQSATPVVHDSRDGVSFARNDEVLFGMVVADDPDVETAARRAYRSIVDIIRRERFPFLLRAWNHVRDINAGDGDAERYKRFCAGRSDALIGSGFEKRDFPAASAVGMREGSVAIYFLASNTPGANVENPRQMSAYEYPRQYGSRSPSFARATIARGVVFVSGTASVVGHETLHAADVRGQMDETLTNLAGILAVCGAGVDGVRQAKVYVRHQTDVDPIRARFEVAFPAASLLVVQSDLCRRELLLEAEVVASLD